MNGFQEFLTCEDAPAVKVIISTEKKSQAEKSEIPYGYCHCGCGEKTNLHTQPRPKDGICKGDPRDYIYGHNHRGANNHNWKGGRWVGKADGYAWRAVGTTKAKSEHILMCEQAIGHPLPPKAIVHHVNGIKGDNRNDNFVICQDRAYHILIHKRIKALRLSGHADWEKCYFCQQYDKPENVMRSKYGQRYHMDCKRKWQKKYRHDNGTSVKYLKPKNERMV